MEEMTPEDVRSHVTRAWLGHLGLAEDGVVYVVPMFYGHQDGKFYFHTLHGTKDRYMRATERACFTITRAESEDRWASVVAVGAIREVTDEKERLTAMDAMMRAPLPPAMGTSATGEPKRGGPDIVYWVLQPERLTGRKSSPPPPPAP